MGLQPKKDRTKLGNTIHGVWAAPLRGSSARTIDSHGKLIGLLRNLLKTNDSDLNNFEVGSSQTDKIVSNMIQT